MAQYKENPTVAKFGYTVLAILLLLLVFGQYF